MISIIVPVFNVENYLSYCLDSIAHQTYKEFEAILVDDGSTDSSGVICDEFCKKDNRFRVIHQKNQGLSGARNTGLSEAKGDYFCFIDSDDYIHPRMIELLEKTCRETGCEIAMSNVKETHTSGTIEEITIPEPHVLSQREMINYLFNYQWKYLFDVVCNKLYSKELIGTRFNHVKSEDTDYNLRIYLSIEKMAMIDCELYYYFQRERSITKNLEYKNHQPIDSILLYYDYLKYFPKEKTDEKAICLRRTIKKYLSASFNNKGTTNEQYTKEKLRNFDKKLIKEIKSNSSIPFFERTYSLFFLKYPSSYSFFRWFMEKIVSIKGVH